jgi:hypothetical protein
VGQTNIYFLNDFLSFTKAFNVEGFTLDYLNLVEWAIASHGMYESALVFILI